MPLSKQEQRLIHYYHSADEQRKKWLADGSKYVGSLDGVEFFHMTWGNTMRITDNLSETLPTGRWLAKQRVGLLQTIGQVAKALKRHPSTIRAVERNNRVIPPGWSEGLRKLGMQLPAPAWPAEMPFYFGEDLRRDMKYLHWYARLTVLAE